MKRLLVLVWFAACWRAPPPPTSTAQPATPPDAVAQPDDAEVADVPGGDARKREMRGLPKRCLENPLAKGCV